MIDLSVGRNSEVGQASSPGPLVLPRGYSIALRWASARQIYSCRPVLGLLARRGVPLPRLFFGALPGELRAGLLPGLAEPVALAVQRGGVAAAGEPVRQGSRRPLPLEDTAPRAKRQSVGDQDAARPYRSAYGWVSISNPDRRNDG